MKYIQDLELLQHKLREFRIEDMFAKRGNIPFTLQYYAPEEVILFEGSEMQSLLFLVQGKARVTSSIETGKSLLLRFIHPFSIVGDIEFIRNTPVQSQVQAVSECLLIGLPFDYIRQFERDNPKLLHMLLEHVSYKLQTCTTASRVNLLASVESKFASYLLSTISPESRSDFGCELQTSNIKEIANLLGTTYRHLNRVIHSLIQRNIIEKDKHSIRILNWKQLEESSSGIRYE